MKPTNHPSQLKQLLLAATFVAASSAHAADGTWITDLATSPWTTTTNWASGTVADGSGFTANFTNDITADRTVTLAAGKTIGNIVFDDAGATGDSAWTISGSTLTLAGTTPTITTNTNATISSILAGTAGLTKTGAGTLNLSGTNTLSGNLTVSEGILNYSTGTKLLGNTSITGGNLNISSGATINLNGTATNQLEAYGVWNISGTLNNMSAYAQSLRSTNITLNGGTMHSNVAVATYGGFYSYLNTTIHAVGSNNVISGAGKFGIATDRTQTFNTATANDSLLVSTDLIHVGATTTFSHLTKTGAGTVTLSGTNKYTGVTTINGGTLQFAKVASLYENTGYWTKNRIIVNTGGTLALNVGGANEFTTGNVTTLLTNLTTTINNNGLRAGSAIGFDTTNAAGGTFTVADNIANSTGTGGGSLGVTKLGTNTLTLSGNNSYSGETNVNAGILQAGSNTAFGSGAVNVNNGGTLEVKGRSLANAINLVTGGTVKVDSDNTGNGSLGTITATGGTFDSGSDASQGFNLNGSSTFNHLSGQGTFTGGMVSIVNSHNPGNSPGTQTFGSGLTYANNSALTLEIAADGLTFDLINITNGLTIGTNVALTLSLYGTEDYSTAFWDTNRSYTLISTDSVTGNFVTPTNNLGGAGEGSWTYGWEGNNYKANWTAVPEPTTALLGSIGVLFLLRRRRA